MPQPCPQRPAPPRLTLLRASRRAAVLASAALALAASGASRSDRLERRLGKHGPVRNDRLDRRLGKHGRLRQHGSHGRRRRGRRADGLRPRGNEHRALRATVRQVQHKLRVTPDGALGPRTRAALRRFQKRHHLPVDGRLRPATLAALGITARAASAASPAGPAATGDAARVLDAIAQCESGGDPTRVSADGQYRGKYQFDQDTWEGAGGVGDPSAAPESEQDGRAASLYAKQGTKPWPVCGPQATGAA